MLCWLELELFDFSFEEVQYEVLKYLVLFRLRLVAICLVAIRLRTVCKYCQVMVQLFQELNWCFLKQVYRNDGRLLICQWLPFLFLSRLRYRYSQTVFGLVVLLPYFIFCL